MPRRAGLGAPLTTPLPCVPIVPQVGRAIFSPRNPLHATISAARSQNRLPVQSAHLRPLPAFDLAFVAFWSPSATGGARPIEVARSIQANGSSSIASSWLPYFLTRPPGWTHDRRGQKKILPSLVFC